MLQESLKILRPGDALGLTADDFSKLLRLTCEMTATAGDIYFGTPVSAEERKKLYETDVQVNMLERRIRKCVVARLSVQGNTLDLPYYLRLMSLVKDVERIGYHAKNLAEVIDIYAKELPDDSVVRELREIRRGIEQACQALSEVFTKSDREAALSLILKGRNRAERADRLLGRIVQLNYDSGKTAALGLGVRYYKRIGDHILNVLSSVVMPLHKVGYCDGDEIREMASGSGPCNQPALSAGV